MTVHSTCSILIGVLLAFPPPAAGGDREYQMKAVFLDKFTRFVQWPEATAVADTSQPFVIGVIGDSPFESLLEQIYAERAIKGSAVDIRYLTELDAVTECHLLFIAQSAGGRLSEIIERTRDRPVLTVADTKGFAERGVLINLYRRRGKVKFEINERAVHASGLTFSYLLLNLARIVQPVK